jgi:hypothetical protein
MMGFLNMCNLGKTLAVDSVCAKILGFNLILWVI